MEIGYLLLKILRIYVFKMAANGGHHFEIKIKTENYKTQFTSQKHAYPYTFGNCYLSLLYKYNCMGLFYGLCTSIGHYWKKINIHCELVTSQPHCWLVPS